MRRILQKIQALMANPTPQGCIKLEGTTTDARYRVRQGDWRILHEINHSRRMIEVVKSGHRREVYR
ncbi:MAG: type II toxin-antitoxin system RelE family toxin [Terriglobia bacterium]